MQHEIGGQGWPSQYLSREQSNENKTAHAAIESKMYF